MAHSVLSPVTCLVLPFFSPHCLINGKIFGKEKIIEYKTCVLIFTATYVWNISHLRKNSARSYHKCTYVGLHVKYRYSGQILIELEFSRRIFKNSYQISWNSVQWEPNFPIRLEDKTDITKQIVASRNSANAFKNSNEFRFRLCNTITRNFTGADFIQYPNGVYCIGIKLLISVSITIKSCRRDKKII